MNSSTAIQKLERTVFEYGVVPVGNLPVTVRHDVLEALEMLPKPPGEEVLKLVIRNGEVALQATQFVGLYQLGPLRLQVLPKIYRTAAHGEAAQREAVQNLFFMLKHALNLPIHIGSASMLDHSTDWFEALTSLFTTSLMAEWQRGPVRRYESQEEDLTILRGRLRLQEHIRRVGRQHILPVEHDEFTANTFLNQVFRVVIDRLLRLSNNPRNRQNLHILSTWMNEDGVSAVPLNISQALQLRLNRLHKRYELPLALAQLFLRGEGLLTHTGLYQGQAMFFDMNTLFEAFLTNILLRYREEILPAVWRDAAIVVQGDGESRPLLIRESTQRGRLHMKPDVLFKNGSQIPLIIDFKYKLLQTSGPGATVGREDLYQMFAYSQRYQCPNILLVYPHVAGVVTENLRYRIPDDGGSPAAFQVATVNLNDLVFNGTSSVVQELRTALGGMT